jgi:type I restriction enzyme S subunit
VHPRFLFEILRAPQVAGDIANRAKGSTMANLSAGALQGVSVPLPPRELQNRFATFADEVGEQIDTLDEQSRKLRTARDLLLPRLMRGELTV